MKAWVTNSEDQVQTVRAAGRPFTAVAISGDGRCVATGAASGDVKIWRLVQSQRGETYANHRDSVTGLCGVAALPQVISASADGSWKIWDLATAREVRSVSVPGVHLRAICADDEYVVAACSDRSLRIWRTENCEFVQTLRGHSDVLRGVLIAADTRRIISFADDRTVRIWDLGSPSEPRLLLGHYQSVNAAAILPGNRIVSFSRDRTAKIWDMGSGRELGSFDIRPFSVNAAATLPNARVFCAFDDYNIDKTLKAWRLPGCEPVACFSTDNPLRCCCMTPDVGWAIAGDVLGNIHFLQLAGAD
jgi:WD40 repeat protein